MAEFVTVMREYERMCKGNARCETCPIVSSNNKRGVACHLFVRKFPMEAECIIMQWSAEHPIITNRIKFEEVFGRDLFKLCVVDPMGDVLKWLDEGYQETE